MSTPSIRPDPEAIQSEEELEDRLSEPTPGVIRSLGQLQGDILFLGVGGKMGPSLARMAKRASDLAGAHRRVVGASRFSSRHHEAQLNAAGIETIRCDLLNDSDLQGLPDFPNIVYMLGRKFGSSGSQSTTWAINCYVPGLVSRKFPHSKIIAFSTGNVYPLVPATSGGSIESDPPNPVGEYGMSALGRERVFEHFSRALNIPMTLIRLNYACELRYGVLVDIANRVFQDQPVDLTMGHLNTIWQGDANAMALQSFQHLASPASVMNLTGLETLSVRDIARQFGGLMKKGVTFSGVEQPAALLSNASRAHQLFDPPRVTTSQLCSWIAYWTMTGGSSLGKPTHFETRDGQF